MTLNLKNLREPEDDLELGDNCPTCSDPIELHKCPKIVQAICDDRNRLLDERDRANKAETFIKQIVEEFLPYEIKSAARKFLGLPPSLGYKVRFIGRKNNPKEWHLSTTGCFKNREEAIAYASRVREALPEITEVFIEEYEDELG